jgi:hypothetical protein
MGNKTNIKNTLGVFLIGLFILSIMTIAVSAAGMQPVTSTKTIGSAPIKTNIPCCESCRSVCADLPRESRDRCLRSSPCRFCRECKSINIYDSDKSWAEEALKERERIDSYANKEIKF